MICICFRADHTSDNLDHRKNLCEYKKVFSDKKLFVEFKYFLEREFSGNMMEFYEEVQNFKSLKNQKEVLSKASDVFNIYLEENSKKEVPVKSSTKENIKNTLILEKDIVRDDLFDNALVEIQQELLLDPWTRFQSLSTEEVKVLVDYGRHNHFKLSDIFENEHLYHVFKRFLKHEYAEEILLYYESIQRLKTISSDSERYKFAKEIFDTFIVNDALNEINLKSETKVSLYKLIQNGISQENTPSDMFDASFLELKQSLLIGIWSRFKTSDFYYQLFE